MKTREKRITAVAGFILVVALIGTGLFYSANRSTTKELNNEKLKSEMILSEKLALEKEIETFRNRINSLSGKNSELNNLLAETGKKLSEKEVQLSRIVRESGNIKSLKKELADLNQMKKDFESQSLALNESIRKLNSEKDALNQKIASLQEENKQLASNLEISYSMSADNYLVETTKKMLLKPNSEKLTVMAKRTKKITVSFKVPENIAEEISFKIIKPDGKTAEGKENGIACRILDEGLMASINGGSIKVSKKIEMTYEPKEKQKPGLYQIEMYNGEKYIGTCNVKLR